MELADTSAWGKASRPGMEWFAGSVEDGEIAVCDMVVMEVLTSAREMLAARRVGEQKAKDESESPAEAKAKGKRRGA